MSERVHHEAEAAAEEPATATEARAPLALLSPGHMTRLQRTAGNRAVAALAGAARRLVARIGTPLSQPLPADAPVPKYGEDSGEQRRYSRKQFQQMWELEQGRPLTFAEEKTIKRGCIGITANNLEGRGNPPLTECYSTFAKAFAAMQAHNGTRHRDDPDQYVVFGVHFWSNQDPDETAREKPDHAAFLPDASGKVDMTGFKHLRRPGYTNFDYAFWDDSVASMWHANHKENGEADPMEVYQSTLGKFSHSFEEEPGETRFGYPDFDREVFGVALAENYDVSKARKPKLTSPRFVKGGKPDPAIQLVFKGRAKLRKGSSPGAVKIVQQCLVDLGKYDLGEFGPAKDGVDGKYGDKTSDAVKQFKSDENLGSPELGETNRGVIFRLDDLFPP